MGSDRACSSCDSVSLYQQNSETSSLLWVSVVRTLSAGKLSSCREGAQISGVRTCLLAEVVFHSPEVLRSLGECSGDLGGVCWLCTQGDPVLGPTGSQSLFWNETILLYGRALWFHHYWHFGSKSIRLWENGFGIIIWWKYLEMSSNYPCEAKLLWIANQCLKWTFNLYCL